MCCVDISCIACDPVRLGLAKFKCVDCSSLPTSKTAAAVSAQIQVLLPNLEAAVQVCFYYRSFAAFTEQHLATFCLDP